MASGDETLAIVVFVLAFLAILCNCASVVNKLCKQYITPKLWKYSLLYQNLAHILTGIGLLQLCIHTKVEEVAICETAGVFLIYGVIETALSYLNTGVILLSIQNPGKPDSISNYHRNIFLVIVLPEVVFGAALSILPLVSDKVVDSSEQFDVDCFPILDHGKSGAAYGTLLVALWWILLLITVVCDVIIALKLWKYNNRVDLSPNNVWQTQLISHGKTLASLSSISHVLFLCFCVITTVTVYSEASVLAEHKTWIVMTSSAVATLVHGIVSNVSDVMWSSCCCGIKSAVQEPHRKLKKLELVKIEAPGKIRMKATWGIGKHASKRGLMKVYGVGQLKCWAQEIVMLGMMRRAQHPSLIQCLWTNSSNPYYETMTLISGEIVTSDSRIICLELTNGGTLEDFLQRAELPLPEPCQRMIIHDIAEGLFYLHHENILHNNLTSSCIYLKGSLQSMVLRAAIGDFEDAELYGTLQQSLDDSLRDKRYFFFPDIRSFALVALEVVSKMCVKKFQNRYTNYNSDQVPLQLNLENMISDEEDEFEAQYCYEIEETNDGMFDHQGVEMEVEYEEHDIPHGFQNQNQTGSLVNLLDRDRPLSPDYKGMSKREVSGSGERPYCVEISGDEDEELAAFNSKVVSRAARPPSPNSSSSNDIPRCKSPEVGKSTRAKATARKSRKDLSRSADRPFAQARVKSPASRSLSPKSFEQRCTSPDPMKDEKLQELRKETKSGKQNKKERKFSFNRKRSDDNLKTGKKNGQAFEAFVTSGDDKSGKKKDGTWLSKPTSILKTIAGNESTVSTFKAKPSDDDTYLDAIEEEDIDSKQSAANKSRTKVKEKKEKKNINEVWDIIDEQYYTQVNKKAMNNLKKTISGESRSSLWSFISTPEDMDDDDLDDILDSLPGMTDNFELRNGKVTVNDILAERETATRVGEEKKRFSFAELSKSRFELIDYYELLRSKRINIEDVPEEKREMLLNVVELKLEDKLKREGKLPKKMASISEDGAIRSDEMYDNGMNPGGTGYNSPSATGNKTKMVSFRQNQCHSSPHRAQAQSEKDPRLDRVRSAPLKRTRTPIQKNKSEITEKHTEPSPAFSDVKSSSAGVAKRSRARSALKRALNGKSNATFRNDRDRTPTGEKQDLTLKYATVKKVNVESASPDSRDTCQSDEVITVPVPTSESFSVTKVKQAPKLIDSRVKRYPSFSSNESASSFASSVRAPRPADVSLTSGELSSLSSQAESDHYETDGHLTDIEGPTKTSMLMKQLHNGHGPPSRVDSGIDSGSMSSEMSETPFNRGKHNMSNGQTQSKGAVNSWARNYKMKDAIPNSPYNFNNKFLPPVYSLPEESVSLDGSVPTSLPSKVGDAYSSDRDTDSAVSFSSSTVSSNRMIAVSESKNKGTLNLLNRPMSPESRDVQNKTVSKVKRKANNRPMSPLTNPVRPSDRPMSPSARPLSSKYRPMSPPSRATQSQHVSSKNKPISTPSRPISPPSRPMSPPSRPMSPSNRSLSPQYKSDSTFNKPTINTANRPNTRLMSPTHAKGTGNRKTHAPKPDVSPSRALSPIEKVDSRNLSKQKQSVNTKPPSNSGNAMSTAPIINVESSDGNVESAGQNGKSNQASRRYRELVKQGVPLRASVIEASPTRNGDNCDFEHGENMQRPGTGESVLEENVDDQQLFEDLESKGFFANRSRSRSPNQRGSSPNRHASPQGNRKDNNNNAHNTQKRKKNKKIPLEELVREKPSTAAKAHRSRSNNHLIVSEDAFLNQPTSEDSETCSIKTNKSTNSSPGSKAKVVVDAELVIDRIFSQNNQQDSELDVEVEAALGLDKNPLKQAKKMYKNFEKQTQPQENPTPNLDNIPLQNGVSQKHIHECIELASSLHVVTVRDLLPATKDGYETLRNKLQQIGQLGSVGAQLLDIIEKCWLLDMPPTSGTLVEQLTDPVTETEL